MPENNEIEELWIGSTNNEALRRINGAIVEHILYCSSCGNKFESEDSCDACPNCGYKECE